MVSGHGFAESAYHEVGEGADSDAVKTCTQAIMSNDNVTVKLLEAIFRVTTTSQFLGFILSGLRL